MASMLGQEGVFRRQNCGFLTFDVPIAADRKKEFPQMTQMTQMSLPRYAGPKVIMKAELLPSYLCHLRNLRILRF
jgi:hypothetical protein